MDIHKLNRVSADCSKEMLSICKLLHAQHSKCEDWMTSLRRLEVKRNASRFDSLLILKLLLPSIESTKGLGNLMQVFLRKITVLMEEYDVLKNAEVAKQILHIVKDFWSLLSNQHVVITEMAFGRYSSNIYEALPSLASVYVDLFISVHSSKSDVDKASKRLYSWLMFELNERCMKVALLEACQSTKVGARLLLPLLRKLLSQSPENLSHLDYLLHFMLLKRWTFICVELHDLLQAFLAIKAPENFPDWLAKYWPKTTSYLPSDKSLKGRRVSELLLDLDNQAVEELIDVFSQCLWSADQVLENTCEHTEQEMVGDLFVIDKRGKEREEVHLTEDKQPSKKKRKLCHNKKDVQQSASLSDELIENSQTIDESDIFMLSGLMEDSDSRKGGEMITGFQENVAINTCINETGVEEIELSDVGYEQKLVSEPVSFVDSSQSYVVSSSEEDDSVVILSDVESPTLSSSVKTVSWNNRKFQGTKLIASPNTLEGKVSNNRQRRNSHSRIVKSLELESCDILSGGDSTADKSCEIFSGGDSTADKSCEIFSGGDSLTDYKTRTQVGMLLSDIPMSLIDEKKSVTKDQSDNSFHVKTRLRNKCGSTISSDTSDLNRLMQRKTSSPAKSDADDLTHWLRKSPREKTPSPAKTDGDDLAHWLRKSPRKAFTNTVDSKCDDDKNDCLSSSLTPQMLLQERHNDPTLVQDVRVDTSEANQEDVSHESRYFLRTHCSHRLLNSETTCLTCSPKKLHKIDD